ncbi:hypothetical protein ACIBO4_03150 [Streptomyces sp. NPDC050149]|uniref:hypothetical protein n=1 Tax=Streptomyces sp. NPDC050149 TaxID=3365603 RepID=UPI00378CA5E2
MGTVPPPTVQAVLDGAARTPYSSQWPMPVLVEARTSIFTTADAGADTGADTAAGAVRSGTAATYELGDIFSALAGRL